MELIDISFHYMIEPVHKTFILKHFLCQLGLFFLMLKIFIIGRFTTSFHLIVWVTLWWIFASYYRLFWLLFNFKLPPFDDVIISLVLGHVNVSEFLLPALFLELLFIRKTGYRFLILNLENILQVCSINVLLFSLVVYPAEHSNPKYYDKASCYVNKVCHRLFLMFVKIKLGSKELLINDPHHVCA